MEGRRGGPMNHNLKIANRASDPTGANSNNLDNSTSPFSQPATMTHKHVFDYG